MKARIAITPEMIGRYRGRADIVIGALTDNQIQAIIDEIINGPREPEIPVSKGMIEVGKIAETTWNRQCGTGANIHSERVAAVYVAMEAKRREENSKGPRGFEDSHVHRRAGDVAGQGIRVHRRKTDG